MGVHARRAVPHLVAQASRWRRRRDPVRRAGRSRGQGLFPAWIARGQSRRQAAGDADRRQRLRAIPAAGARSGDRQGHRDGHRRRHRPAGVDQRFRRTGVHRGQRQLAKLSRPLPPARLAGVRGHHAVRGGRGTRLLGRRRQVARQEPDHHFDRRQCDQRSPVRFRRGSDQAPDADLAEEAEPRISRRRGARETVDSH